MIRANVSMLKAPENVQPQFMKPIDIDILDAGEAPAIRKLHDLHCELLARARALIIDSRTALRTDKLAVKRSGMRIALLANVRGEVAHLAP